MAANIVFASFLASSAQSHAYLDAVRLQHGFTLLYARHGPYLCNGRLALTSHVVNDEIRQNELIEYCILLMFSRLLLHSSAPLVVVMLKTRCASIREYELWFAGITHFASPMPNAIPFRHVPDKTCQPKKTKNQKSTKQW